MAFPFNIEIPGNYPGDIKSFAPDPRDETRIIFICDIRGFTSNMELNQTRMMIFLKTFLQEMSDNIIKNIDGAYINKFLGDGILAHLPGRENDVVIAVNAAFNTMKLFEKMKHGSVLATIGLSIVISRELIYRIALLNNTYRDHTLIGKKVNRVFRALNSAKGNLVLIFEDSKEMIKDNYVIVDIGERTFKGVDKPVPLFSIFREKREDEVNDKLRICSTTCSNYKNCKYSYFWGQKGMDFLNCEFCPFHNKCSILSTCRVRSNYYELKKNFQEFECCHVCSHFKQCFHNYYRGKSRRPMIWCGVDGYPYGVYDGQSAPLPVPDQ